MNKYAPDLNAMRQELSEYITLDPQTPQGTVMALHRLMQNISDLQLHPSLRREFELLFELISDGNTDSIDRIQDLEAMVNRNANYEGDYMGEWLDD